MKRIAIIILIFLSFLFSVYFLFPKYSEFKSLKGKVSEKESIIQEREAYFLYLEDTLKTLEKYETAVKKINSALPDTSLPTSLLSYLQKKSSENGLILKALSQVKTAEAGATEGSEESRIKESHFSLSLTGSLPSFESFLKTLEKSSRMIEVEDVSLGQSQGGLLEINLSLKVYSY